jgi:hypothetical protein
MMINASQRTRFEIQAGKSWSTASRREYQPANPGAIVEPGFELDIGSRIISLEPDPSGYSSGELLWRRKHRQ